MISLWFLVTRPLEHHTGEASSTIRTTSPSACTDSNTEMHEHKHLMRQAAAEQVDKIDEKKYGKKKISLMFVSWTQSDK